LNRSLVSDHSPSEAEIAIAKLKKYKLWQSGQISAELIQARNILLWDLEID
jgi:hypothetical protein